MKFGKEFRTHLEETLPEWRDKFLCYKPLKKLLKRYPNATLIALDHAYANRYVGNRIQPPLEDNVPSSGEGGSDASAGPSGSMGLRVERNVSMVEFQEWFVRLLNEELEKFNDFYMEKEEDFVIRFQELKERIEKVKEKRRGEVSSSEGDFSAEMMDIRREFVTIHGEMVLLKNYSSLNFAGLVKILKKYDKRTGGLLRLPFTQLALHQPFFTTEPLTRLVRECEANLDLLFPLEEEVTESASAFPPLPSRGNQLEAAGDHPPFRDVTNVSSLTTATSSSSSVMPPLGEAIMDIYRNTVSAMRTIEGLRMSSTYNPLSFATLFRNQEEEGSGAVTAENSAQQGSDDDDNNVDAVEKKDDSDDVNSAP